MALNLQDYVAKMRSQGMDKQSQITWSRPTLPPRPAQPPIVDNNNITSKHTIPSHYAVISGSPFPDGAGEHNNEGTGDDSGKDGKRKKRHKLAKIDESMLVGPSGLPALIESTKDFVPEGKGYEVQFQLACVSWFYLHTCTSLW
jgi:hypothetical protein